MIGDVVVLSGGMDSTVLAYDVAQTTERLVCVSFDYGQRHVVELQHAAVTARKLDADHRVVDLSALGPMLKGSALTDGNVDVPHGHYADDNMRKTVVPNRNMVMLSIAAAIAVSERCRHVLTAVHAGDHAVYPDCRPEFVDAVSSAAYLGTLGFAPSSFSIAAPYVSMTKTDIARRGELLSVPWSDTWSCYEGGTEHCGRCGTCCERIMSMHEAGVVDPTQYEDADYWRSVIDDVAPA